MAMGIPMVVNSGWGDAEQVIGHPGAGVVVHAFNDQELNRAALSLTDRAFNQDKIRQIAADYFSLDEGIDRYTDIYELSKSENE